MKYAIHIMELITKAWNRQKGRLIPVVKGLT